MLTSDGHIKIADFGSVKPMQDSQITLLPNAASGKNMKFHVHFGSYCKHVCKLVTYADDKAFTFVGTAAYVPPEVLNSSPANFG